MMTSVLCWWLYSSRSHFKVTSSTIIVWLYILVWGWSYSDLGPSWSRSVQCGFSKGTLWRYFTLNIRLWMNLLLQSINGQVVIVPHMWRCIVLKSSAYILRDRSWWDVLAVRMYYRSMRSGPSNRRSNWRCTIVMLLITRFLTRLRV